MHARTFAQSGIGEVLNNLHPDLLWRDATLQVGRGADRPGQVHLDGRWLVLVPTVFCTQPTIYAPCDDLDVPAVLFYPALRHLADAVRLWLDEPPVPGRKALAALLGATRAAALDAMTSRCTTTDLARRLGVSLATASHHATVLRNAHLITTARSGGSVVHLISPLGAALLNGDLRLPGGADRTASH